MMRDKEYRFSFSGIVERGNQIGRTIDFPTANIKVADVEPEHFGVYVCTVKFADRKCASGVCNLGVKPTVGSLAPLLEVHIFDFNDDIYDQTISIFLHEKLRDEQRFDSLSCLREQLQSDKIKALSIYSKLYQ